MKRVGYILFVLGFLSCEEKTQGETVPLKADQIVGSWQLVAAYVSPGGDTTWQEVENGDVYDFFADGTFSQTHTLKSASDRSGNFTYANNTLRLTFTIDGAEKWQSFNVERVENSIILSPAGPILCIEACLYRYERRE